MYKNRRETAREEKQHTKQNTQKNAKPQNTHNREQKHKTNIKRILKIKVE